MDSGESLLPLNATDFEKALEGLAAFSVNRVDVDLVKRMRDPYLTSVSHLPFLAWGRGVDLWRDNWPEWKKRRITAEIYGMKGLKGTLPGINKYLSYMDASIYDAVIPPVGMYLTDYSADALDKWREQFAELRLYPYSIPGERPAFAVGDGLRTVPGYVGGFFVMENEAARYYGRRATIVEDEVETEIRSFDQIGTWGSDAAVDVTTFAIPADYNPIDTVVDNCYVGLSYVADKNRGRLITIGQDGTFGSGQIPHGVESVTPLSIAPERVYERHSARYLEAFLATGSKTGVNYTHVYSDASALHIYDRWRLLDDTKARIGQAAGLFSPFINYSYIGLTSYTALLRVKATYRREGMWSYVGHAFVGNCHIGLATERVKDVGEAIYKSRSLRDQIWFTTATYRPMRIADLSFTADQKWDGMVPIERTSL
ncbi:phage tail protein I [Brucella pseudogrignonensis]|uniref:Phage tail protein I n=1 Tax=Brucella pseudogrignonensis TaxID=419475 RepID=A0A7Y3WYD0_9HYPH|nr:phage tail protein I [Brucella pseudogrignonensis]MCM0751511.1 phage tail protein I [Brucella pseudogrignonensis]NNV22093.1 phage tail protein I [Brucella pseudogrignonensis]